MQDHPDGEERKTEHPSVPEFYASSVQFVISTFDVSMTFGVRTGENPEDLRQVAVVRMSPQHALIVGKLLMKNMAEYEDKVGKINLPAESYTRLGISKD